jgi:two-component system chemotaxis response regulator CheY
MPNLLIVDDNVHVRKSLEWVFANTHFSINMAADGQQALDYTDHARVDAVLSDVNMPGMDGIELCRRLQQPGRRAGPPPPVWLMTGAPSLAVLHYARLAGAQSLLTKPFDCVRLVADINEALGISTASALESRVSQP